MLTLCGVWKTGVLEYPLDSYSSELFNNLLKQCITPNYPVSYNLKSINVIVNHLNHR